VFYVRTADLITMPRTDALLRRFLSIGGRRSKNRAEVGARAASAPRLGALFAGGVEVSS